MVHCIVTVTMHEVRSNIIILMKDDIVSTLLKAERFK